MLSQQATTGPAPMEGIERTNVSSSQIVDLVFSLFYFSFLFLFHFIFYF